MQELAEYAIRAARAAGATYAEARLETKTSNAFIMKNGSLEGSEFGESAGLGIRLVLNNTLGFGATNILTPRSVRAAVQRAAALARHARRTRALRFALAPSLKASYAVKQAQPLADISPDVKLAFLKSLERGLLETGVRLPTRLFILSDELDKKLYVNSEGTRISSEIPRISLFYLFTVAHNGKHLQRAWQAGAASGWEAVDKWAMPQRLADESKALQRVAKFGIKVPARPLDIIVGPQVAGIIAHESCGHPFEADRILGREAAQAGESWITPAMLGQRLARPVVSLVDCPDIEGTYGFYKFDDEGVAARPRYLIKGGIINTFLHNRESAGALSTHSNGSARAAAFDKEPLIRMSNTYFEPGEQSEAELLEGIRRGVYFKTFTEWNIDDRRYNNRYVSSEAYLIENGRLTKPVRPFAFEITTPALYAAIDGVGSNLELHPANCGKGEPMQDMPVTHGGGSLRLRGIRLR